MQGVSNKIVCNNSCMANISKQPCFHVRACSKSKDASNHACNKPCLHMHATSPNITSLDELDGLAFSKVARLAAATSARVCSYTLHHEKNMHERNGWFILSNPWQQQKERSSLHWQVCPARLASGFFLHAHAAAKEHVRTSSKRCINSFGAHFCCSMPFHFGSQKSWPKKTWICSSKSPGHTHTHTIWQPSPPQVWR